MTSTNPASNALLVPVDQQVSATFSKTMNYATVTTSDFLLTWSGGHVVGTVTYFYDAINKVTTATFAPQTNLRMYTLYTATITTEGRIRLATHWQVIMYGSLPPVPIVARYLFGRRRQLRGAGCGHGHQHGDSDNGYRRSRHLAGHINDWFPARDSKSHDTCERYHC